MDHFNPSPGGIRRKLAALGGIRVDGIRIGNGPEVVRPYFEGGSITVSNLKILTLLNGEVWVFDKDNLTKVYDDYFALCEELGIYWSGCPDSHLIPSNYCQNLNQIDLTNRQKDPDYLPELVCK